MKARYSILLLVGAAIGAAAIGLTWVQTKETTHQDQATQAQKKVMAPAPDLVSTILDSKEPVYRVHKIVGAVFWKKSRAAGTYRRLDPKAAADSLRLFYGGERLTCNAHSTLTLMAMRGTRADTVIQGPRKDWPVPRWAAVNNDPAAARDARNTDGRGFPLKLADKKGLGNPHDWPGDATVISVSATRDKTGWTGSARPTSPVSPPAILLAAVAALGTLSLYVWLKRQKSRTKAVKKNGKY